MRGRGGLVLLLGLLLVGCGERAGAFVPYEAGGADWMPGDAVPAFPDEWGAVLSVTAYEDCAFDSTFRTYTFATVTLQTREENCV